MMIVGDQVSDTLDAAMRQAMNRLGEALRLPPLVWRASTDIEGMSMEAHAPRDATDPMGSCAEWAAALGLQVNSHELRDDVKTWYSKVGKWYFEITSATSFWEMWPDTSRC
jgi:CO/xanthine dehydrogenase Mo-binding subunit